MAAECLAGITWLDNAFLRLAAFSTFSIRISLSEFAASLSAVYSVTMSQPNSDLSASLISLHVSLYLAEVWPWLVPPL